jgi:outer membrane receptor protein involved in Fe transport
MSERFNAAGAGATVRDPFPILVNGVPTTNVSTVFSEIRGGNPAVAPEKADTVAAGFVIQPSFVQGLSFSVDWYSITNKDAIALLGPQNIVTLCFQGATELCSLISRDPITNAINGMDDRYRNINGQKVVGTDVEADYQLRLGGGRSLGFRLISSYLDQFSLHNLNVPVQQQAGTTGNQPLPRVQANFGVNYAQGPFSLFVNERYISDGKRIWNDNEPGGNIINDDHIADAFYTDMNIAYTRDGAGSNKWEVYLNVQNVFDRIPPRVPIFSGFGGTTDTNRALFDVLGRRFVLGLKYDL